MTHVIQQLIGRLEQLPKSLQDRYVARWTKELNEENGDGAVQKLPHFEDIEHFTESTEESPDSLSTNPAHMEGIEEKRNLRYSDIEHLAGIFEGPGDLSTNPAYLDNLGKKHR